MSPLRNLGDIVRWHGPSEREAIVDLHAGGQRWTFGQIDERAAAIARGLVQRGFAPAARLAILAANSADFVATYLGIMRAGFSAVPINYRLPRETVEYILQDCAASAVFVDAAHRHLLSTGHAYFELDGAGPNSTARLLEPGDAVSTTPEPTAIAEILYTSGSTGRPKGVPLSHAGQLWALGVHVAPQPLVDDCTLIVAPLYHMNAIFNVSLALANQVRTVLMPKFDARRYLEAVAEYRCTMLSGIPTMFAMMARELDRTHARTFDSVKRISIGSAPLTEALIERVRRIFPNAHIRNGYGTTEAGPSIFGEHPAGLARPTLALGHPLPEVSCRLVGGPSQDEGVLEVRTPALLAGYLNLPDVTAQRLRDGWYTTGDLMRRDAQGFFYFVGRDDDMFVCGGENIYPGEVEKMLERHPGVLQAAVVAVPDDIKGQIPIAFVVPARRAAPSPAELKAFALREGPAYSHPRAFVMIDELPLAGTHKVDKKPLLERALALTANLGRDVLTG
ncbi:MAG: class I adenylate-forming enzyme family protein [Steroidobacteraceae bacterium]